MKNQKTIFLFTFSICVILIIGCAKDGETGPQGPQGNANVVSVTKNVASNDWIMSDPIYYVDLTASNISQDILNGGTIQVFMESTTEIGVWLNLPWVQTYSSYFSTFNFNYSLGSVRVSKYDSDNTQTSNPGVRSFKIVAIAGSARHANPNVDWTNYSEIESTFYLTK